MGWLWILNRLIKIIHLYSSPPFYPIIMLYATSLYNMYFLLLLFVLFWVLLYSSTFSQLESNHSFSLMHLSLTLTHDQTISSDSHLSFHLWELSLFLIKFLHFVSCLSLYVHLLILTFSF